MLALFVPLVFGFVMIVAAIGDVMTFRIPNRLVGAVALSFLICAVAARMPFEVVGAHALVGLAALAVGFALFLPGYIGGGDAKLIAGAAMWLGPAAAIPFAVYTTLLGGILAVGLVTFRALPLPMPLFTIGWINRLHAHDAPAPYGIAIAAGALIAFAKSPWVKLLV